MVSKITTAPTSVSSAPKNRKKTPNRSPVAQLDRRLTSAPLHAHRAYAQINFKSSLASHKSWGAAVSPKGEVNFKLFTWTDAKKVFVQIADSVHPKDMAHVNEDLFPIKNAAGEVTSIASSRSNSKFIGLLNQGKGVFERKAAADFAKHGQNYRFVIVKNDNSIVTRKDPYSMHQPNVLGWSKVYDHNQFKWNDKDWQDNKVKEKISRQHFKNGLTNPYNMRIYEVNVATLTKDGTFESAKKELARIKKDGFNAIHIMPVENTPGVNWGYDGVDKFAPQESVLGGPDKLKELIDLAHSQEIKMNVIMDIVPNHIGPDGNFLSQTGPYSAGPGSFGDRFNYEGKDSENVQEYIGNTAMHWIRDYHCDGLRVDMTKFMESDFAMKKMAAEVHYHHPDAFIIAEDGRDNDPRVTRALKPEEETFATEDDHVKYTDKLAHKEVSLDNIGFDSEWDFPYHKQIASAVLGNWEKYSRNLFALDGAIRGSRHRVKYPMSHDEEGNMDGTKLIVKSVAQNLNIFQKMDGASDCERGQRTAHFAQKLCVAVATGQADAMRPQEWMDFHKQNNMKEVIPVEKVKQAFNTGVRSNKLAIGQTEAADGITMIFQGNESGKLNYFKFFREMLTPDDPESFNAAKGYLPGKPAYEDSKLDSIKYSAEYQKTMDGHENFTTQMNNLVSKTPALQDGEIVATVIHDRSDVYALHRQKDDSEIYAVSNFSQDSYDKNYSIRFPEGQWKQVLNSESKEFGGEGKFENTEIISSKNDPKISLPPNSIVFFEKVKPTEVQKP